MKNFKKIFLIVYLALNFYSCDKPNDKNFIREYYDDEQIKTEVQVKDSIYLGKMIEYYKNGDTLSIGHWVEGLPHGLKKNYYEGNFLKSIGSYKNGIKDGGFKLFYKDGNIEQEGTYRKGILHGKVIRYFHPDSAKCEINFISYFINYQGKQKEMGYVEYNPDRTIKDEKLRVNTVSQLDTVKLGEVLEISIEFTPKLFDSIEVVIGNFDELFYEKDSSKFNTIKTDSGIAKYKIKASKIGDNFIRGYVVNYKVSGKDKEGNITGKMTPKYFFEHKFFVIR